MVSHIFLKVFPLPSTRYFMDLFSNLLAEGRKIENAKHWKLMVVPIFHQNGGFISQNSMGLRAQEDIQVNK